MEFFSSGTALDCDRVVGCGCWGVLVLGCVVLGCVVLGCGGVEVWVLGCGYSEWYKSWLFGEFIQRKSPKLSPELSVSSVMCDGK